MMAVALRSFFIRRATPSRTAFAMLVRRAFVPSKRISSVVVRGLGRGGAGGAGATGAGAGGGGASTTGSGAGTTTGGGGAGGHAAYVTPRTPPKGLGLTPFETSIVKLAPKAPERAQPEWPNQMRAPPFSWA